MFAGALHLHESSGAAHHDVHVHLGLHVLGVLEIGAYFAVDHADAHGCHPPLHGRRLDAIRLHHPVERIHHRHARAGDRRRARAAVGLQHVAVHLERELAPLEIVDHRANAAPDEPLDLLRAATHLLALARRSRVRRARQHRVLGGEPAFAPALLPAGDAVLHAGGAQHARIAEGNQARPLGVRRRTALHGHRAHRARRARAGTGTCRISHEVSLSSKLSNDPA